MRHESEANLLGVVFTPRRGDDRRPYRVVDAGHWAFDGTGLKEGDLFGQKSLHGAAPAGRPGMRRTRCRPVRPRTPGCWPGG